MSPDVQTAALLTLGLARGGFEVTSVPDEAGALRALGLGAPFPSVVVADAASDADGLSLCRALRADSRTAHLPILLLTDACASAVAGLEAGADEQLARPLFIKDVVVLALLRAGMSSGDRLFDASCGALPLAELTRALLAGMRSGRVELANRTGSFAFQRGNVVSARFESLEGEAALERMLCLADGLYSVHLGPGLGEGPMCLGAEQLCQTLLPDVLQWRAALPSAPALSARPSLQLRRFAELSGQLPREIDGLVRLADGQRSVRQLVLESPLNTRMTLQAITRLFALQVFSSARGDSGSSSSGRGFPRPEASDSAVALSSTQSSALHGAPFHGSPRVRLLSQVPSLDGAEGKGRDSPARPSQFAAVVPLRRRLEVAPAATPEAVHPVGSDAAGSATSQPPATPEAPPTRD